MLLKFRPKNYDNLSEHLQVGGIMQITNNTNMALKINVLPSIGREGKPLDINTIRKTVEMLKSEGKYEEAVELLEGKISSCSSRKRKSVLLAELAKLHSFFGKHEISIGAAEEALSRNPLNLDAMLAKGESLTCLKRYKEAVRVLNTLTNCPHAHLRKNETLLKAAYHGLASCYLRLYESDLAIKYADKALKIDPDFQTAMSTKAFALLQLHFKYPFGRTGVANTFIYLRQSADLFMQIDPERLLEERAQGDHRALKIYNIGRELKQKLGAELYNYETVREVILSYPPEQVPLMINAYRINFIKYVPDYVTEPDSTLFYKTPQRYLSDGYGDCDDLIPFASEILTAAGVPHVTIKFGFSKVSSKDGSHEAQILTPSHIAIVYKQDDCYFLLERAGIADAGAKTIGELLERLSVEIKRREYQIVEVDAENHAYEVKETVKY